MHDQEYHRLRLLEDHYWWHGVLRTMVMKELRLRLGPTARVLDVGCGTGGMLSEIQASYPHWSCEGVDISLTALEHCQSRGLSQVKQADVAELPFPAAEFDAVICLDVLYHEEVVEDLALAEMQRVLKTGGCLIMNLPAFAALRGAHDAVVCGARLYTVHQVLNRLRSGRMKVNLIHYWNAWLFIPLLLWRRRSRVSRTQRSDMHALPTELNRILRVCGGVDAWWCRALKIPFGSSLFVVAVKR